VSAALADHHVNLLSCSMKTGGDAVAAMQFDFELGDPSHLSVVLGSIREIDGVYESYRVLPGSAPTV
jgi:GTP pyrophosphokinase